jgi:hypothetical protein
VGHDEVEAPFHVHAEVCGPVEGVQQKSEVPLAATTGELHSSVTPSVPYGNDPGTHEYACPEHVAFVVPVQPGATFPSKGATFPPHAVVRTGTTSKASQASSGWRTGERSGSMADHPYRWSRGPRVKSQSTMIRTGSLQSPVPARVVTR